MTSLRRAPDPRSAPLPISSPSSMFHIENNSQNHLKADDTRRRQKRERPVAPVRQTRLDIVDPGRTVVIEQIDGDVDGTLVRLMELGLVPGAAVVVTRRAPLGDPLELAVLGTRVCLRRREARAFVVVDAAESP